MIRIIGSLVFSVFLLASPAFAGSRAPTQLKLFKKLWKGKCNAAISRDTGSGSNRRVTTIPFTTFTKAETPESLRGKRINLYAITDIPSVTEIVSGIPLDDQVVAPFAEFIKNSRVDLMKVQLYMDEANTYIYFLPVDTGTPYFDGFAPDASKFSIVCK